MQIILSTKKNLLPIIASIIDVVYSINFKIHLLQFISHPWHAVCHGWNYIFCTYFSVFTNRDTHSVPRKIDDAINKDNKNYLC